MACALTSFSSPPLPFLLGLSHLPSSSQIPELCKLWRRMALDGSTVPCWLTLFLAPNTCWAVACPEVPDFKLSSSGSKCLCHHATCGVSKAWTHQKKFHMQALMAILVSSLQPRLCGS